MYGIRYVYAIALRYRQHSSDVARKRRNLVCGGAQIVQRIAYTVLRILLCVHDLKRILPYDDSLMVVIHPVVMRITNIQRKNNYLLVMKVQAFSICHQREMQ